MTEFAPRKLYGGSLEVELPRDYLNASDFRTIPDHQEVFLSNTTLTSVIFEINEYQTTSAVEVHSNVQRGESNQASEDEAASTFHFVDTIDASDTLDPESFTVKPEKVIIGRPSLSKYPAYLQEGLITGSEVDRGAESAHSSDWQNHPPTKKTETKVFQLLIRVQEYETDLCVRVNVPLREYDNHADHQNKEISWGKTVVERISQTLQVNDFQFLTGA